MPARNVNVSLDQEDLEWLVERANALGLPVDEYLRQTIRKTKQEYLKSHAEALQELAGLWEQGDGLTYQQRQRTRE